MSQKIDEFLYMDPDTGMVICMVQDEDGFRPATAFDEHSSVDPSYFSAQPASVIADSPILEQMALDRFVSGYERAYVDPLVDLFPSMG